MQSTHWRIVSSSALLLTLACTPSAQDCHNILPVISEPVTVTTTPAGTHGCSCLSEGVLVVAEARHHGLSWARGQLWVDGTPVSEQDFPARLSEVKTRKQMEAAAARAKGAAEGVRDQ